MNGSENYHKKFVMPCSDPEGCPHFKAEQRLREAIEAQKEYIKLLGAELDSTIGLAYSHGWRSTRAEKGKELRKRIKQALKGVSNGKEKICKEGL